MEEAKVDYYSQVDFLKPAGEASLIPPDSPQWYITKNPITTTIGAGAAVLFEFADPRIRSGVWDHSVFKIDPAGRGQRTAIVGAAGIYGPASMARRLIGNVNRMHAKVKGTTPSGEAYSAIEPELLDWVSATAAYSIVEAYHRYVRPVSREERAQYYKDGHVVARLFGVREVLNCDEDFFNMLERLLPRFEAHEINSEFLDMAMGRKEGRKFSNFLMHPMVRAGIAILPPSVREAMKLGKEYDFSATDRFIVRTVARIADQIPSSKSAAWQGAVRVGLPGNFAWLSKERQRAILASRPPLRAPETAVDAAASGQHAA